MSDIKITIVPFHEYTGFDYVDAATFYILSAMGDRYYFHTSDRAKAQACCDEIFGKSKYTVKASKNQKIKSRLESGELSCRGSTSRKGTMPHLKGITRGA